MACDFHRSGLDKLTFTPTVDHQNVQQVRSSAVENILLDFLLRNVNQRKSDEIMETRSKCAIFSQESENLLME